MHSQKWSPYLTASEVGSKLRKHYNSVSYEQSKERKNISEKLHVMKVRIKQLEKEEQKARLKTLNALALTDSIIEKRVEKKQRDQAKDQVRRIRQMEINELKERNKEMREDLRMSIMLKKAAVAQKKKFIANTLKEIQLTAKMRVFNENPGKSGSASPRQSQFIAKVESVKENRLKAEEEKERQEAVIKEIKQLEELERVLIEKLKSAYDRQKVEEHKVALLMENPVIVSKHELNQISSQNIPVVNNM